MTEGSTQDDEEGKKGQDPFARAPGHEPFKQGPIWPTQKSDKPSQSQIDTQNHIPSQSGPQPADQEYEDGPHLNFPETAPKLQLPPMPRHKVGPHEPQHSPTQPGVAGSTRPAETYNTHPDEAHNAHPGGTYNAHPAGTYNAHSGGTYNAHPGETHNAHSDPSGSHADTGMSGGFAQGGVSPSEASPWARAGALPANMQPGQTNPDFIPPAPAPTQENPGFVPTNAGAPHTNPGPVQRPELKPGAPIITSASTKPNWTQPQWPSGNPVVTPQMRGFGPVLARRTTGTKLPPAIAPLPEAPYSQAPPTASNAGRPLFGGQGQSLGARANELNYAQQTQTHGGLRNQLSLTIQRDLILTKKLFGTQTNRPATQARREYKQTEYIPKAPKLKVSAPDPDRPWKPVPAATYEFFPDEEKPQPTAQNTIHALGEHKTDVQSARGFNPETPLGFDQGEGPPDPRYAPFQGELIKDIALQDKRAGHAEDPIPAETRERGAAALRALGRNSDHYYETHAGASAQHDELPRSVRLTSRDLFGLATYYFIVTKEVLTAPHAFFANMSLVGGLNDPLLYLLFTSVMTGVFAALAKLNPLLFFFSAILSFLTVSVGAIIMQFVFKRLGGEGKFEQTFNVMAYSKATFIFAWISLGPWPIGMALATIFTAYLNYLGLSRVHSLPAKTTWLVIGIMTVVPILFKLAIK